MANKNAPDLLIENATIRWRNFTGVEKKYNRAGDRNFHVVLDKPEMEDIIPQMIEDGWNITVDNRDPAGQDDGWEPRAPSIEVAVRYDKGRPPKIVAIIDGAKTTLTVETVEMLDWADIANVDLIVHPSYWNVSGADGLKGYLKTMFVTINQDELERKYDDFGGDDDGDF